ncbi:S-layer homology domain-containing protein [Peptoniphilus catoniae]|uniref:S-layer homology domain-containing protein n=1 Tax=Peptoniphilus catoniae TaxID=1660341 RepID=UPI0010FD0C45|nr:S-layer homology domain-containing protein [Peptoniphilus catoniae]
MKKKLFAIMLIFVFVFSFKAQVFAETLPTDEKEETKEVKTLMVNEKEEARTLMEDEKLLRAPSLEKTFILTELDKATNTETEIGQYDTLFKAMEALSKRDRNNKDYVLTLTKDYIDFNVEGTYNVQNVNLTVKSDDNGPHTLKASFYNPASQRQGYAFLFSDTSNIKFENITLDGEGKSPFISTTRSHYDQMSYPTVTLGNGTLVQNFVAVTDGGAEFNSPIEIDGKLIIEDGATIKDNTNNKSGKGIIYCTRGEIEINGGTFENNESSNYGGLIMAFSDVKVTINGGEFVGNKAKNGGVIYSNGELNINGGNFVNNQASYVGGVVHAGAKAQVKIKNANFANNSGNFGGAIYTSNSKNVIIEDCDFNSNVSGFGAIYFNGGSNESIKNSRFNNNFAFKIGSAIYNRNSDVKVENSEFKNNGEITDSGKTYTCVHGGAIAVEKLNNDNTKLTVKASTFEGNKAEKDGGAIHTSDSKYEPVIDPNTDYKTLDIDGDTVFKNNSASGYFNPPENISELANIKFKESSFKGTDKVKPDHILNNYDINYKANIVVTYNPNNGDKVYEDKLKGNDISQYVIKSDKDVNFTNNAKLLGWSRDKNATEPEYKVGDKVDLNSNLYLYAVWEKSVVVTYDPNNGDKVYEDKLEGGNISQYVIKSDKDVNFTSNAKLLGWSRDKNATEPEYKVGDKVDLNSNLYLYALWAKKEVPTPQPRPAIEVGTLIRPLEQKVEPNVETHIAYIKGYPDNTVRPEGSITRAEAVTMLVRLKGYPLIEAREIFKDVEKDKWYSPYIDAAYRQGILEEKEGELFRPDENITRGELAQLISHIDKKSDAKAPFTDIEGYKYKDAIDQSYGNKRIMGYPDNSFRPNAQITRAETAAMLNRLFDRSVKEEGLRNVATDGFKDLKDKSYWAYYEIIEASYTHNYIRLNQNTIEELWKTIIK